MIPDERRLAFAVRPTRAALGWAVLALVSVLPCRGEADDGVVVADEARILSSAKEAIRSHRGGVFIVRIEGSCQLGRSWAFWDIFTVEEALKAYRNDEGAYFVPLMANEKTPDRKSLLVVGERYLIVTRLKWAAWSPLYVEEALRMGAADHARLLAEIRSEAQKNAVYGSSWYLRSELGPGPLEVSGVQTPHADGLIDPEPFGFTRESVRAAVKGGMQVLLVRPLEGADNVRGDDHRVEILEDLASAAGVKRRLWVRDSRTDDERAARAAKMPAPYRIAAWCPHRRYVVFLDPRAKGLPVVKEMVPDIRDDGPTARRIRSWLEKAAAQGDGKAARAEAPRAEPAKGPASADELSRELLASWMRRQYDLERAGVKEASCKVRAKVGEAPGNTAEAAGEYRWDGKSGSLVWDNERVGAMLAREGWNARKLDMWFKADRRMDLDGTKLSAARSERGAIIRVEGGDITELRFDGDGALTTVVSKVSGLGGPTDSILSFTYARVGDVYAWNGWTMELQVGATRYFETNAITTAKVGDFLVMTKALARSTVGSPPNQMELKKVLTFSDWKINGKTVDEAVEAGEGGRGGAGG